MGITLRCRGPTGQSTLAGVEPDMSIPDFLALVSETTDVPHNNIEILMGFPPKLIQLPENGTVAALGLDNGDALTVRQGSNAGPAPAARSAPIAVGPTASTTAAAQGPQSTAPTPTAAAHEDEDEMLARAIAASLEQPHGSPASRAAAGVSAAASAGPLPARNQGASTASRSVSNALPGGPAPTSMSVPGGDGSCVVRRVIDSDNSCLFNAVGYVMDRSRHRAAELRKVVANAVLNDPVTFNEGFLGKDVQEYCRWIQDKDKWGGAIELFILSAHYGREIAAYDIRTRRCDVYGQDKGYTERSLLIYDGLHYDALAVAAFEGAPEELDVTMFPPHGREGKAIMTAAEKLVAATNSARQFTDTANFTLRCGVCQIGLKGEKEAVEHAKATGHSNFAEY